MSDQSGAGGWVGRGLSPLLASANANGHIRDVPEREYCSTASGCDHVNSCPVGRPLLELGFRRHDCRCGRLYLPGSGLYQFEYWWMVDREISRFRNRLSKRMRDKIKERDDYRCVKCGDSEDSLEVHHIVAFGDFGSHSPENLITLCWNCHRHSV